MIVKVISGIETEKGLKNSLNYIDDPEKLTHEDKENQNIFQAAIENADENSDLQRAFRYIGNEDKIKGKYLSGYMCNPETAFEEFMIAREETMLKAGKKDTTSKYIAFHLVQSMPEGLDISDEEVHQCGIELVEKIGAHQAVIASHVHPVIDKKTGEITGKCKHNHILLNAYIHPDKLDPRFPNRIKYIDENKTYAKLQMWNDQIALEHGLPIIANPDLGKTYSWAEQNAIKYNLSWKEHIRMDIDELLFSTNSWNEYVEKMTAKGYEIKQGKYITYITPEINGERKRVRDYKLGRAYTKDALLSFWKERAAIKADVEHEISKNTAEAEENFENQAVPFGPITKLFELSAEADKLYVALPIGSEKTESASVYYLPLDTDLSSETLKTYFKTDTSYDIYDASPLPIAQFYGQDIYNFILMKRRQEQEMEEKLREQNERIRKNQDREKQEKKKYYSYHLFINSRTKKPYRIGLYDHTGRRRSNMELMFILAAVVLKKEDSLWSAGNVSAERENEIYFGKTDIKAQRMMDSIQIARNENIHNLSELDARLNESGAQLSRTKAALNKNIKLKDKMQTLHTAVNSYLETKDIAEPIFSMPEGLKKDEQLSLFEDVILSYNKAKSIMYRYKVRTDDELEDFKTRYANVENNIARYEEKLIENKEEYRKLKKLKYNASLAEDPKYCYGPQYGTTQEYKKDRSRNLDRIREK